MTRNVVAEGAMVSRILVVSSMDYEKPKKPIMFESDVNLNQECQLYTRVGTLIVATIYLQNRYMFRSFTVLQCSHQHCVQPVASDVEVVGYL